MVRKIFQYRITFHLFRKNDLNNYEKSLIYDAINLVSSQSKDLFETTIEEFNKTRIKLSELKKTLSKVDADMEDELILDYSSKKNIILVKSWVIKHSKIDEDIVSRDTASLNA